MADVTISGLDLGSPSKSTATIPFSDGTTTYKTSPSGIVAASPGCVLQVVFGTNSTAVSHTSTYVDVITLPITIKGSNSKVFVSINQHCATGQDTGIGFRIQRNSTSIVTYGGDYTQGGIQQVGGAVNVQINSFLNFQYVDSGPLTKDTLYTYSGQANRITGGNFVSTNYGSNRTSTITLMEIAG
jgi:hypothetical protein